MKEGGTGRAVGCGANLRSSARIGAGARMSPIPRRARLIRHSPGQLCRNTYGLRQNSARFAEEHARTSSADSSVSRWGRMPHLIRHDRRPARRIAQRSRNSRQDTRGSARRRAAGTHKDTHRSARRAVPLHRAKDGPTRSSSFTRPAPSSRQRFPLCHCLGAAGSLPASALNATANAAGRQPPGERAERNGERGRGRSSHPASALPAPRHQTADSTTHATQPTTYRRATTR
jgi:hypothetical protein